MASGRARYYRFLGRPHLGPRGVAVILKIETYTLCLSVCGSTQRALAVEISRMLSNRVE